MGLYYFDTSAVVKYYVTEPGSNWVRQLMDELEPSTGQPYHGIFVAGDRTLLAASRAEGLAADNPFDHLTPHAA